MTIESAHTTSRFGLPVLQLSGFLHYATMSVPALGWPVQARMLLQSGHGTSSSRQLRSRLQQSFRGKEQAYVRPCPSSSASKRLLRYPCRACGQISGHPSYFPKPSGKLQINTSNENLETLLLEDVSFFSNDKVSGDWRLGDWRRQLDLLPQGSEERKGQIQWLFRYGLGHESNSAASAPHHFFSFCQRKWAFSGDTWHCATCDRCRSVARRWHCGRCKKCKDDVSTPCDGCGGRSSQESRGLQSASHVTPEDRTHVTDIFDDTAPPSAEIDVAIASR